MAPTQPKPLVATAAAADGDGGGTLAFTGADVAGTVVVGLALIGTGVVVLGASRRRRSA